MKTREKIVQTAKVLFSKYNYNSVSMNDIATKINITKPALYHHFSGKEELYFEVMKIANDNFNSIIKKIIKKDLEPKDKIKELLKTSIDFKLKYSNIPILMIKKVARKDKKIIEFIKGLKNETFDIIEPVFQECKSIMRCEQYKDTRLIVFLVMAQIHAYIADKMFIKNTSWTVDEVVEQITCSLFK